MAIAILSTPAYAGECYTPERAKAELQAKDIASSIISDASQIKVLEAALKAQNISVPAGVTRMIVAPVGSDDYIGAEVNGCLYGPVVLRGSAS